MSFGGNWNFPFGYYADPRETMREMETEMERMNAQMRQLERVFSAPMFPPFPGGYPPFMSSTATTTVPQFYHPRANNDVVEEDENDETQFANSMDWIPGFDFGSMHPGQFQMSPQNSTQFISYSSSSYTGPGGQTYSSSSTTRTGPGGVREMLQTVQDGRQGTSTVTVERGIGDRSRRITRTRDANGVEESRDLLRNMEVEEARDFDQEWSHVQYRLPQNRPMQRRIE